jgi:hypothetical protein
MSTSPSCPRSAIIFSSNKASIPIILGFCLLIGILIWFIPLQLIAGGFACLIFLYLALNILIGIFQFLLGILCGLLGAVLIVIADLMEFAEAIFSRIRRS